MTWLTLSALAAALVVFAATPGPGTVAVISCALGRGFRPAAALGIGLMLGDLVYLSFVLFGLSLIAQTLGNIFVWVRVVGALYLIWLGIGLWRASGEMRVGEAVDQRGPLRTALSGLAISLGNPKVIAFYLGFLPAFLDLNSLTSLDAVLVILTAAAVVSGVLVALAAATISARQALATPRRMRILNRIAGTALIGGGIFIAAH